MPAAGGGAGAAAVPAGETEADPAAVAAATVVPIGGLWLPVGLEGLQGRHWLKSVETLVTHCFQKPTTLIQVIKLGSEEGFLKVLEGKVNISLKVTEQDEFKQFSFLWNSHFW